MTETSQYTPITPTRQDIEAWRRYADWAEEFGWISLGEFNWVRAVRSLIAESERLRAEVERLEAQLDDLEDAARYT